MGIEDGLVLGVVLCNAHTPEDIEDALDLYQSIRRNRASAIQILSNVGQDQSYLVREELKQYMDGKKIPSTFSPLRRLPGPQANARLSVPDREFCLQFQLRRGGGDVEGDEGLTRDIRSTAALLPRHTASW